MLTEYGKILRKLRIDKQELLKDMADCLDVSSAYLSAVETGKRRIPANWTERIIRLYRLDAHAAKNISAIDAASEKLNAVCQAASADMYSQQGAPQQEQAQNQGQSSQNNSQDGEVTDTDFEEVK